MINIKKFESVGNEIEEFYKDKIDWKFYNYLTNKTTKYEDAGFTICVNVLVCEKPTKVTSIYFGNCHNGYVFLHRGTESLRDYIRNCYDANGLFYYIGMSGNGNISESLKSYMLSISNKSHLYDFGYNYVIVSSI